MSKTIKNRKGEVLLVIADDRCPPRFDTFLERDLSDAVFDELLLEGATFDDTCELARASFRKADLYWANFYLANLADTDFEGADLRGADMKQAVLQRANLRNANLGRGALGPHASGAQLDEANLCGADLRGANIEGAVFHNARYDLTTRFPKGFDPDANQMVLVHSI